MHDLARLVDAVQRNCHIADARHARELTLCTYLLEMREFYRWENQLPLTAQPSRADLSAWLAARETLWSELEDESFSDLPVGQRLCEPFAAETVNAHLLPHGLVYGGGIGRFGKPHFFLGRLARREQRDGIEILVVDCEYARDLMGFPAAMRGGTITLRREALKRWLWEKVEIWGVKKPHGPLATVVEAYGFAADPLAALDRMADNETESIILHELGEAQAEDLLGEGWAAMVSSFTRRRAELVARAVRDNLADCLCTLPALLARGEVRSLHFWFANFEGMRRSLFPSIEAAYRHWLGSGDDTALRSSIEAGRRHWEATAKRLLAIHAEARDDMQRQIEALAADHDPEMAL